MHLAANIAPHYRLRWPPPWLDPEELPPYEPPLLCELPPYELPLLRHELPEEDEEEPPRVPDELLLPLLPRYWPELLPLLGLRCDEPLLLLLLPPRYIPLPVTVPPLRRTVPLLDAPGDGCDDGREP